MESEKTKNSPYCRRVLVVTILSVAMPLGYIFTSLNPLVVVIRVVYNKTYQERYGTNLPDHQWTTLLSLTMTMAIVGGFCGSLTVSFFLRVLSRKQTILMLSAVNIVGSAMISVVAGTTGSWEAFIIGRFVVGIAIGLGLNTLPVVIAEYCAAAETVTFQSMLGFFLSVGAVFGPCIGHQQVLGSTELWPFVVAVGCIFPLVYICGWRWIPETPYMLLRKNERGEAVKLLRKLRVGSQICIEEELALMENEQAGFANKNENPISVEKRAYMGIKDVIKIFSYRRQLLLVIMLYVGVMFTGINHVVFYSDQIFLNAGIAEDVVTYVTIGVFAAQAMASLFGMRFIQVVGSRRLMIYTLGLTVISHVITVVSLATNHLSKISSYMSIVGILMFLISYAAGPNLTVFALAGELTIEPTRQTIISYAGGLLWITSWLVGFSAAYLDAALGAYSFVIWLVSNIVLLVMVILFIPETKGKSMMEIQRALQT